MAKLTNPGSANNAAFGQYGCVYIHDDTHAAVAPNGMVFCALQFLEDTELDGLVAEGGDQDLEFTQRHTGQVLQCSAANSDFFIDQDTETDLTGTDMEVGDLVYGPKGDFLGTVKLIGRNKADDADDTSGFHLDRTPVPALADDEYITVIKANGSSGGGSSDLDADVVFPKGMTIFGSWRSFAVAADADNTAGVIGYLAPGTKQDTSL